MYQPCVRALPAGLGVPVPRQGLWLEYALVVGRALSDLLTEGAEHWNAVEGVTFPVLR